MNKVVSNSLMGGDKFVPESHLRQPGFTHSAYGSFCKRLERIKKFIEIANLKNIYYIKLDKTCFSHGTATSDGKGLAKKLFSIKAYEIGINTIYDGYQR